MSHHSKRQILNLDANAYDAVLFVGDVHGCFTKLRTMTKNFDAQFGKDSKRAIVLLGDIIDRGPHSSGDGLAFSTNGAL